MVATLLAPSCKAQKSTAVAQTTSSQADNDLLLTNVFNQYINLKNALTKDNGDNAQTAARELFAAIDKVPMDKLTADKHKIWKEYADKLSYDAEHIKGTNDLDHQREHFTNLSANMYKAMKALNINSSDMYYQFCPMADDGKGAYWVSEQSKISNPYMGKKMPTCGSTKETIKVKK